MNKTNIFDNIIIDKKNEEFTQILKQDNIRIERIVSNGQSSDENFWYDQEENEFVMVLEGHSVVEFEDKEMELHKGDYLNIPAHCKHRVKHTDLNNPTVWLAVFY